MEQLTISQQFLDGMSEVQENINRELCKVMDYLVIHGELPPKSEDELLRERLKYARITRNGVGTITFVDNETFTAYLIEGDNYYGGKLVEPLTKDKRPFVFERWCTMMDF